MEIQDRKGGLMKTRTHHFSVAMTTGVLTAHVPDEGGEAVARDRLKNDDPIWRREDVQYHGLVEWFDPIAFEYNSFASARSELGLGDAA